MAMSKKEREAFAALETELALRWPRYERPAQVTVPEGIPYRGPYFVAWTFNAYSKVVEQGCSSGSYHSVGRTNETTTQRGAPPEGWFATELDALKALRIRLSEKFADELAAVDRRIAEAEATQ